ncbi:hypothetical protein [Fredinandcohnia quinoae]|uniref:Uncharacterized protein n=1 Tax=Fredinandcohnia quinoae TaxID=2918902 RepID=A0AAW5E0G1_9BACI|nr:hypothetical protein [Fredinandcohnia sp. SECRCQ15]MCH1626400.1 hypothetical protein [Fredinandcohnia sp. SECRCQ15]
MKIVIIVCSVIFACLSLTMFSISFMKSKSKKEKAAMTIAFFSEPLDSWSSLFYLGLLGLAYSLIIL